MGFVLKVYVATWRQYRAPHKGSKQLCKYGTPTVYHQIQYWKKAQGEDCYDRIDDTWLFKLEWPHQWTGVPVGESDDIECIYSEAVRRILIMLPNFTGHVDLNYITSPEVDTLCLKPQLHCTSANVLATPEGPDKTNSGFILGNLQPSYIRKFTWPEYHPVQADTAFLQQLQRLTISFPHVRTAPQIPNINDVFQHLSNLTWLQAPNAAHITDKTFTFLPKLQYLNIDSCSADITDDAFAPLVQLQHLSMRYCVQTNITDDAFRHLKNLTRLDMEGCGQSTITSDAFTHLQNLVELDMTGCTQIDANSLSPHLSSIQCLRNRFSDGFPWLWKTNSDEVSILETQICFRHLTLLDVESTDLSSLSDDHFAGLSSLRHLNISGYVSITDNLFAHLSQLTTLQMDDCTTLSDKTFRHLSNLSVLSMCDVDKTAITDDALSHLSQLRFLKFFPPNMFSLKALSKLQYMRTVRPYQVQKSLRWYKFFVSLLHEKDPRDVQFVHLSHRLIHAVKNGVKELASVILEVFEADIHGVKSENLSAYSELLYISMCRCFSRQFRRYREESSNTKRLCSMLWDVPASREAVKCYRNVDKFFKTPPGLALSYVDPHLLERFSEDLVIREWVRERLTTRLIRSTFLQKLSRLSRRSRYSQEKPELMRVLEDQYGIDTTTWFHFSLKRYSPPQENHNRLNAALGSSDDSDE